MVKKALLGFLIVILLVVGAAGAYVASKTSAFDESISKKYDFPIPEVKASTDAAVLERGRHLAHGIGGCVACHGENLAGGKVEDLGPLGRIVHKNLTPGKGSALAGYSDGELARLLRHAVKKDGTSARLMPVQEFFWWSDDDRLAVISYLRSLPPVDQEQSSVEFSAMAKVLDRMDTIPIDQARRVDHTAKPSTVTPGETPEYGKDLANICSGCHGPTLAGGPIPGTPPNFGTPRNLTPHESGLKDWAYEDFDKVLRTGIKKDGQKISEFMPIATTKNWSETEMKALWLYLRTLPPRELGAR